MNYETWEKRAKNHETFSDYVLRKMKEQKIESTDFYKAADLTRDLFSKINCHRDYLPSKITAIKCCLGLRLDISEHLAFDVLGDNRRNFCFPILLSYIQDIFLSH